MQPLDKDEMYVDSSSNKVEFLRAIVDQLESGVRNLDKVRALIAENESRTMIGSDWLGGLGIKLNTNVGKCGTNCINEQPNKLFKEFTVLFLCQGRLAKKRNLKKHVHAQQKRRSSKVQ